MPRKFGKRMDDGGTVTATSSAPNTSSRRERYLARMADRYGDKFARLKEKYPTYNWGATPKTKQEYKSMWESFRDWRKDNRPSQNTTPKANSSAWMGRNFSQYADHLRDPSKFFSSDLFKKLGPDAASAWERYKASITTPAPTPAPAPAPVTTPSGVAAPGLQNNWASTVNKYFPQTMKAGGLVRGGGAAQRGVGKGKMR